DITVFGRINTDYFFDKFWIRSWHDRFTVEIMKHHFVSQRNRIIPDSIEVVSHLLNQRSEPIPVSKIVEIPRNDKNTISIFGLNDRSITFRPEGTVFTLPPTISVI